jgi:hypothetical protein
LGQCGEDTTRKTGKCFVYDVVGDCKTYDACSVRKARQKHINRDWKGGSVIVGESLYMYISSIKGEAMKD